jgi:hypothetical protein
LVAASLTFESAHEVALLSILAVKSALLAALLFLKSGLLVSCFQQITVGGLVALSGLAEVEVLVLRNLGQLASLLLKLVQVVFGGGNTFGVFSVLSFLVAVAVTKTIDLLLVTASFFLKLLEFVASCIDVFAESVWVVALGLSLTLVAENLSLAAGDLITKSGDFYLHVIVCSTLIVQVVASIVALLLQAVQSDAVGVLTCLEFVLLEQLLILQVSVLRLNAVQLVAQGAIVLVPLLDLEDLGLELTDEEVLLVASQVHTIVILQNLKGEFAYSCHLSVKESREV